MANAWDSIEKCMKLQGNTHQYPAPPFSEVFPLVHVEHESVIVSERYPNLVLWNGQRHVLVLMLKGDNDVCP
jgi:hypothetical protein